MFEPFFTTKEKGRGTGLGLAMVYGFVKQSGGHITIYSELGHGTTFNLYFPRVDGITVQASVKGKGVVDPDARETILVVEDDDRVRQLTITRLKLIGYQVLEASDGPKALDLLTRGHPVDLVFTDLVMPGGMSGREVAARARQLRPGIKVLLTSGYAEELVHGDDLERERLKVLRNRSNSDQPPRSLAGSHQEQIRLRTSPNSVAAPQWLDARTLPLVALNLRTCTEQNTHLFGW